MPLPRLGAQPSAEDQAHECFCCSLKERRSQGAFCIQRLLWDYYFSFLPSSSLGSPFCSPSLSQHNSVCALSNLNLFSLMRGLWSVSSLRPPSPTLLLSLPPLSSCSSPPVRLYQEALKSFLHTRYFCTITFSFLSPFPLHLLPAFALPRASLERFGPLVPTNTRGPTFCFGTHEQGLLGRGRKQASPPPPFSTLGQHVAGSLLSTGGEDWPG